MRDVTQALGQNYSAAAGFLCAACLCLGFLLGKVVRRAPGAGVGGDRAEGGR